jgi:hypothetical protein
MDKAESSVFRPDETDGSEAEDSHPHACTEGLVFLTYTVYDEEIGDEVERLDVVPCRRCAEAAKAAGVAY